MVTFRRIYAVLAVLMCVVAASAQTAVVPGHGTLPMEADTLVFVGSGTQVFMADSLEVDSLTALPVDSLAPLRALHAKWTNVIDYSPALLGEQVADYVRAYPGLLSVDTIGRSVEGRPLLMLRMGHGPHRIFCLGALHGREYVTTALLMKDIEHITLALATGSTFGDYDMEAILDSCTYYIVPMINPDGVDIAQRGVADRDSAFRAIPVRKANARYGYRSWKANGRGVDLNRNFAHGWGRRRTAEPCSEGYPGEKPESEPETVALVQALRDAEPEAVLSYHSQGEELYISQPTRKGKRLAKQIVKVSGYKCLRTGPAYGSLQDHVDHEHHVFYVCIELCPHIGPRPYPASKFYTRVWPKARYLLPLAGQVMGCQE